MGSKIMERGLGGLEFSMKVRTKVVEVKVRRARNTRGHDHAEADLRCKGRP